MVFDPQPKRKGLCGLHAVLLRFSQTSIIREGQDMAAYMVVLDL